MTMLEQRGDVKILADTARSPAPRPSWAASAGRLLQARRSTTCRNILAFARRSANGIVRALKMVCARLGRATSSAPCPKVTCW